MSKKALFIFAIVVSLVMIGCSAQDTSSQTSKLQTVGSVDSIAKQAETDMTGWKTVITYPANGSVIAGRTVNIKGTAKPNSYLWPFVTTQAPGDREADRACLSGDGHPQGKAQTDSKGNFEFILDEPCSKNIWLYVASEDVGLGEVLYKQPSWEGLCQSDSERISFTLSGELPESCNKNLSAYEVNMNAVNTVIYNGKGFNSKLTSTSDGTEYVNWLYGSSFSMLLPKSWNGILESKQDFPSGSKIYDAVRLASKNDPLHYILIEIVKIEDMSDSLSLGGMRMRPIASNSKYAFYYSSGEDLAGVGAKITKEELLTMSEISAAIKSFKFLPPPLGDL